MKYLCLGYHDERAWQSLPSLERDAMLADTAGYIDGLKAGGHLLDQVALQSVVSAATLRFDRGQFTVTDGPFAETKEQLGGAMLLEASDLNHAIQLMSHMPCMRCGGSIEIRPVNDELTDNIASGKLASSGIA